MEYRYGNTLSSLFLGVPPRPPASLRSRWVSETNSRKGEKDPTPEMAHVTRDDSIGAAPEQHVEGRSSLR